MNARDEPPFSNSTEGHAWIDNWCGRCVHDASFQRGEAEEGCPLLLIALLGRTPVEWLRQEGNRLGDTYHCVMFRDEDDGPDLEPRPVPDPPGQGVLVSRERFEGVRMLTVFPEPVGAAR